MSTSEPDPGRAAVCAAGGRGARRGGVPRLLRPQRLQRRARPRPRPRQPRTRPPPTRRHLQCHLACK